MKALPPGNIRGSGSLTSFQPVRNFSNCVANFASTELSKSRLTLLES